MRVMYADGVDERLISTAVAARLGIALRTWWAYVQRGQAPAPDGREELSGKPWWWSSTIDAFEATRPGKPGRPRTR